MNEVKSTQVLKALDVRKFSPMEKAYDPKELGLRIKKRGLDVAEEGSALILLATVAWLSHSAKLSVNKVDDFVANFYPTGVAYALEQVDQIDPESGLQDYDFDDLGLEKAYQLKDLVDILKREGLDVAEDGAAVVVVETFGWLRDSALASKTELDDILVGIYPHIERYVLAQVDRIDGQDDPES